jgi:hypothetical protein
MADEVVIQSINITSFGAGTALLFRAPSDASGGGITILGADLTAVTAGTTTAQLVTLTSAGTPVISGTVNTTAAGGTLVAGVPAQFTITDGWIDGAEWLGVVLVGAPVAGDVLSLRYAMGR